MGFWNKCPLLSLVLAGGLMITAVSWINRNGVYREYKGETVMTPVLGAFFWGIREGVYPWTSTAQEALAVGRVSQAGQETGEAVGQSGEESVQKPPDFEEVCQETAGETQARLEGEGKGVSAAQGNGDFPPVQEGQGEAAGQDREERAVLALGPVEESYFDDALFIGDSRTQGLYEYGGFGEQVTFYCKTSLTVYDLFKKEKAFIKEDGRNITLKEALGARSFQKIYLMIGINEMGTGTADTFFGEYQKVIREIMRLQPDAVIFVQAIMHVGAQKNASDPVFNNNNIKERNEKIATLADGKTVFFLDVNGRLCDENGNLSEGFSNDQVHLKAKYYKIWKQFLMENGAVEAKPVSEGIAADANGFMEK